MLEITDKRNDFGTICICAIRYALGRQTYMPGLVMDFVKDNISLLNAKDKAVMIQDIKKQEEYGYGADFDKRDWMNFLEILEVKE